MRALKWNMSHAVFVAEIDDDHKEIFDGVAQLRKALSSGVAAHKVNDLTVRLAGRIEDHFAHEERLMQAAQYSLFSWHELSHDAARKRVSGFIQRISTGDVEAAAALVKYMVAWLHDHTRLADKMLGAFLRNKRRVGKLVITVGTKEFDSCAWRDSRGERLDRLPSRRAL